MSTYSSGAAESGQHGRIVAEQRRPRSSTRFRGSGRAERARRLLEYRDRVGATALPGRLGPVARVEGAIHVVFLGDPGVVLDHDGVDEPPFGGGLEGNIGAFKLGGRFQYNYLFSHINTGGNSVSVNKGGNSDFWSATVDLGASFH